MAMKCYVLPGLLQRVHSANVHAMVSCELNFYSTSLSTTFGRTVIDGVVAEKDVAEFQFHRYCIHPMGMGCHRLNAVNHIDLACVCIHQMMVPFESIKKSEINGWTDRETVWNGMKKKRQHRIYYIDTTIVTMCGV